MKRWGILTGLLLLLVVLFTGCGASNSEGSSSGKQILRVGMDASYPPFGSQD